MERMYLLGSDGVLRAAVTYLSGIGALVLDYRAGCVRFSGRG